MDAKYAIGQRVRIIRVLDALSNPIHTDLEPHVGKTGTIRDIAGNWKFSDKQDSPLYTVKIDKSEELIGVPEDALEAID